MNREIADERPHISSKLRWKDVVLPAPLSAAVIDKVILSCLKPQWLKVARVVGDAVVRSNESGLPIDDLVVAAHIQALAETGVIESQGDLRKWRFSEVRLKG